MKLYLLRHGDSESRAATDAQRQLTSEGLDEVRAVAKQFSRKGVSLGRCFSSPYIRADQTAKAFLAGISQSLPIEYDEVLTPEKRAWEVMAFLSDLDAESVLLVSHNPLLSELNAMLVEGNIDSMIIMGTCDIAAIEADIIADGLGKRLFYLSPETVQTENDH